MVKLSAFGGYTPTKFPLPLWERERGITLPLPPPIKGGEFAPRGGRCR